jgi:hypothetical protein
MRARNGMQALPLPCIVDLPSSLALSLISGRRAGFTMACKESIQMYASTKCDALDADVYRNGFVHSCSLFRVICDAGSY